VQSSTIQISVTGQSASATLTLNGDGTFTGTGTANVSLPVTVPGVTLSGTATLTIDTSITASGNLTLTTPVGTIAGTFTLSATRTTRELTITATGVSLALGTSFSLSGVALAAQIRPDGTFALRASGTATLTGFTFTGTFAGEINTLGEDTTLGGALIANG